MGDDLNLIPERVPSIVKNVGGRIIPILNAERTLNKLTTVAGNLRLAGDRVDSQAYVVDFQEDVVDQQAEFVKDRRTQAGQHKCAPLVVAAMLTADGLAPNATNKPAI